MRNKFIFFQISLINNINARKIPFLALSYLFPEITMIVHTNKAALLKKMITCCWKYEIRDGPGLCRFTSNSSRAACLTC